MDSGLILSKPAENATVCQFCFGSKFVTLFWKFLSCQLLVCSLYFIPYYMLMRTSHKVPWTVCSLWDKLLNTWVNMSGTWNGLDLIWYEPIFYFSTSWHLEWLSGRRWLVWFYLCYIIGAITMYKGNFSRLHCTAMLFVLYFIEVLKQLFQKAIVIKQTAQFWIQVLNWTRCF